MEKAWGWRNQLVKCKTDLKENRKIEVCVFQFLKTTVNQRLVQIKNQRQRSRCWSCANRKRWNFSSNLWERRQVLDKHVWIKLERHIVLLVIIGLNAFLERKKNSLGLWLLTPPAHSPLRSFCSHPWLDKPCYSWPSSSWRSLRCCNKLMRSSRYCDPSS